MQKQTLARVSKRAKKSKIASLCFRKQGASSPIGREGEEGNGGFGLAIKSPPPTPPSPVGCLGRRGVVGYRVGLIVRMSASKVFVSLSLSFGREGRGSLDSQFAFRLLFGSTGNPQVTSSFLVGGKCFFLCRVVWAWEEGRGRGGNGRGGGKKKHARLQNKKN